LTARIVRLNWPNKDKQIKPSLCYPYVIDVSAKTTQNQIVENGLPTKKGVRHQGDLMYVVVKNSPKNVAQPIFCQKRCDTLSVKK
jgi:hypothetical protein